MRHLASKEFLEKTAIAFIVVLIFLFVLCLFLPCFQISLHRLPPFADGLCRRWKLLPSMYVKRKGSDNLIVFIIDLYSPGCD